MLSKNKAVKADSSVFKSFPKNVYFRWSQMLKLSTPDFKISRLPTKTKLNKIWGGGCSFLKVLIIRGIGYRAFRTLNDLAGDGIENNSVREYNKFLFFKSLEEDCVEEELEVNNVVWHELASSFFLTLRAGHTEDAN